MSPSRRKVSMFGIAMMLWAIVAPAIANERPVHRPRRVERQVRPVRPSGNQAVALEKLTTCQEAHAYLIEAAVEMVLHYRYGNGGVVFAGGPEDVDAPRIPDDYTTTNNQVAGVDELDIVKTNGTHLYALDYNRFHLLRSWPAETTAEVGVVDVDSYGHGLFLDRDRVISVSQFWGDESFAPYGSGGTRFEILDISVPSRPTTLRTIDVEGFLVDSRLIDGHLYAVIWSQPELPYEIWELSGDPELPLPEMPANASAEVRDRILATARRILMPIVTDILIKVEIADLLPQHVDVHPENISVDPAPLLQCGDLFRPSEPSRLSVLSVFHLDVRADEPISAVGLLADGWEVYASLDSVYVAKASDLWWWGWPESENFDMTTAVHKFTLDPESDAPVTYTASGEVDGWLLNQFSMSEFDDHLRIATTEVGWWGFAEADEAANSVTILADDGDGRLVETGRIGGMGPGERIFAVRFMGPKGYVVTFEQIDPLFTLDLSDPTNPSVIGELEITGFSSYLHPIGDDWLLAVGQEADEEGRIIGLAVSIFDVREFDAPRLAHRYLIENEDDTWSWSESLHDHHAFTFHRGVLSIPVYIGGEERFHGLIVLSVDPEDGIVELGRISHHDLAGEGIYAWMRRSVYIEDFIYSLSTVGVKVNRLRNPEVEVARVPFEE